MFKRTGIFLIAVLMAAVFASDASAFWLWTPKDKTFINPKYATKDTPREQFDWAMNFYEKNDFQRAADEFVRLVDHYPDSDLAPDAQYYAGRSYEELGKYYFAYQNYQKTLDKYPYTKRLDEITEREFNIAKIFETEEAPKLMNIELNLSVDRAVEIYKKIVENNPFGPFADKSLYRMGEVYRRMGKYKEAADAYEKIVKDYPESKIYDDAKYQLAYTRYEASLAPEYDQEDTEQALREFKKISETTPVPAVAEEANEVIDELKSKQAASTMKIAEFYERQKKYRSALVYYRDVAAKFKGMPAAETAQQKVRSLETILEKQKNEKKNIFGF